MKLKIIDNFLNIDDLKTLQNFFFNDVVDKNNIKIKNISDPKIINKLNSSYHDQVINILNELCPEKAELYDYTQYVIVETGLDFKFPIHDDDPNKILSGVVYLSPKKNIGTMFYENKKGDMPNIIDWKINRAIFFSRKERQTWHSYKGDGKQNRLALVYNLMTKNIKKVYEVENKNYYMGILICKLNSHLYRYFKFII